MQILTTLNMLNLLDKLEVILNKMLSFLFNMVHKARSKEIVTYHHVTEEDYNKIGYFNEVQNRLESSENRNILYLSEISRLKEELDILSDIVKGK